MKLYCRNAEGDWREVSGNYPYPFLPAGKIIVVDEEGKTAEVIDNGTGIRETTKVKDLKR